ncbi:putative type I restriction enzyme, S subunit [Desulfonatronospira thiodismutans ASO3-1]|uniref:Type I restriction enzyme, S subunit n=1 Tax=Desulfonatronospira thiodismutans ASO3-1 TaxID=555779 RepID=D6SP50_9BACT|nr:restriction endonuclease subunit S [Desulfonatronospira thiodismutans]EFI34526.1 putative type I restriction enzyme, S subunit [Desulfonatronospira thiodismutans ASO3-1]
MIDELKPYAEYKDSGLPWASKIPTHWKVRRAKNLFRCIDVRSKTGTEERLTVSAERGVVPRSSMKVTMFEAKSYIGHKRCWPDDLVINSLWAWGRGLGVARHHGLVSSAYGVYRLRPEFDEYAPFIHHLVRSKVYHWELRTRSKGVWISRLQLTDDAFLRAPILVPSVEEGKAITRFIRDIDRKVNAFIRNRRRLIKVLNEQKQAIINRAVTRGLDPNVPLKPSGVDWLGNIPKHWEKNRLKFLVRNVNEQTSTRQPDEVYVALEHVEGWTGRITLPSEDIEFGSQVKRFHVGDVLFGKLRPYLAKVTRPSVKGVCVGEFLVLRRKNEALLPEFLEQELRSKLFIDIINSATFGAKMPRADWDFIGNLLIVYPPTHAEQLEILSDTGKQTASLQAAIDKANREVSLIQEYRTRLIADVVTGKVDVRNVKCEGRSVNEEEFEDIEEVEKAVDLLEESEDDK